MGDGTHHRGIVAGFHVGRSGTLLARARWWGDVGGKVRLEAFVPDGRLLRVGDADDAARFHRARDEVGDVVGPFGSMGIQQGAVRATRDQIELPFEVDGVAGRQQSAVSPTLDPARLKGVQRVPHQRGVVQCHAPGCQQPPGGVRFGEGGAILVVQAPELPRRMRPISSS
ncbi:hypothetical protein ACFRCG_06160 [Embleya sp. NPDC056575]|uniref:hypothetical protein n=1 Tax=unclassified Embleya TaxID=2699296 RepID=UPI003681928C